MTDRVVAVLVRRTATVEPRLAEAMLTDVVDLVTGMPQVEPALAVEAGAHQLADRVSWPGTPQVTVPGDAAIGELVSAIAGLAREAAAVVVGDVPDLPPLLLGKLFSAIAGPPRRSLAVCPAGAGGLVAVAAGFPASADWLTSCDVGLDDPDAVDRLGDLAPPRALVVGPGWHRIRAASDLALLDRGLEGWEATRAALD